MTERRSRSSTPPNAEASGSGPSTRYQMNPGTTRRRSVSPPLPTNTTSSSPTKSPRRTTQREVPSGSRTGVDTDSPSWAPTSPELPSWLTPRPPLRAETTTDTDSRPRQRQRLVSPPAPAPVAPTNEAAPQGQAQHPAGFIFRIPTRRPAPAPTGTDNAGAERTPSNPPDGGNQGVSDPLFITWTFQVRGGEHTQPQAHALPHPRIPSVGILPVGPRPPRNPPTTDTNTDTDTDTRPLSNEHPFLPFPSGSGPMGMGMGMRMGPFGPVSIPPSEMPQFIPIPRTRPAFPDPREMIPPFFGAAGIPGPSTGAPGAGAGAGAGGGEGEGQHEIMFFPIGYTFFPVSGPTHPGPAKAAELVKVLSNVDLETMEALDLKIRTEEKGQNQDELGWKCGICLQGLEDEDKPAAVDTQSETEVEKQEVTTNDEGIPDKTERKEATGVKTTPCNHLFHGGCLQPWFERHLSCPLCRKSLESLLSARTDEAGSD